MTPPVSYGLARQGKLRRGLTGLVVAVFIAAIVVLAADVQRQMARLATASSDNVQWVLSQAETEVIGLEIATLGALEADPPALDSVRLNFDIFYSRVDTLSSADVYSELRTEPIVGDGLTRLQTFLDTWVPVIDGPDDALSDALPQLLADTREARFVTRRAALAGIELFSRLSDESRESVLTTLLRIALLTASLVVVLLMLVAALMRLARKREQTARENRATIERMQTILSTSQDAVIVTGRDGRVIEYNGAAERTFGYLRDEAIGAQMADLIIPDHFRKMHNAGMARYLESGKSRVIGKGVVQLEARHKSGDVFPVDLSLASAQAPEGAIFVGFLRDISHRVRAENDLKEARDKAIAGEKSKAELLAVMSHEMRTPLNGMLGTLDLFDPDQLDQRHRRYLRIIRNSGKLLLGHVNDVLDISRLDAGKMSMNKERFDLITFLEEIIEGQMVRARENGNELLLAPCNPALHEVYSDPNRLRQIMLNLVGNAIKFTRNGRIVIEADCQNGLDEVELRVTDTGVGIAEENLSRIFGDFVTIDASYGRSNTGTGLGLGIARRLATALGGELGAESEPGDGSVFWLRLPLSAPRDVPQPAPEPAAPPALPEIDLPPLEVLLVEDNAVNRLVAREMLERDGHMVVEAHNGREGVELARTHAFDIILMDISMPEMDGLTATCLIRSEAGENSHVPIIATTAHALPEELRRFREAGMTDVLIKPLSMASVRRTLTAALIGTLDDEDDSQAGPDSGALIDWARLNELLDDLPEHNVHAAFVTFDREMRDFLAAMPDRIATPDHRDTLGAEAHRMAGSAGVFGAVQLTDMLRALQHDARTASDSDLADTHRRLQECWVKTVSGFKKNNENLIFSLERPQAIS